jgi:macrolide transport system ATP-binding/permease protein
MSLISVRNLIFSYVAPDGEETSVLRNINLEVHRGEMIAIQGASGSGKSTLLYVLGGLLTSYSGHVRVGDHEISEMRDSELAHFRNETVGFIFQQFYLLPHSTVLENIMLPNQYARKPLRRSVIREKASQLAIRMGMGDRLQRYPRQLSGGQQQRVAIARALLNNPEIILADEPTGNLDFKNSERIMKELKAIRDAGHTVIIVTHDPLVAEQCDRILNMHDGHLTETEHPTKKYLPHHSEISEAWDRLFAKPKPRWSFYGVSWPLLRELFRLADHNLRANMSRTLLTMTGVVMGIASILALVTLGNFTRDRVLDSYSEMGANTLAFFGYPNFETRATDKVNVEFRGFDLKKDIEPLKRIFPEIKRLTPMTVAALGVSYAGRSVPNEVRGFGVSQDWLGTSNRKLMMGKNISDLDVYYHSPVCLIGHEIYLRLFKKASPIGEVIYITQDNSSGVCRVIGVLEPMESNRAWDKPNLHVYMPVTYMRGIMNNWNAMIFQFLAQVDPTTDVQGFGKRVHRFFSMRYPRSGTFEVGADSQLISQMNKFLGLFTVLLMCLGLISLAVGGVGITNMMLVSISERIKEIGLRKAFGATDFRIRLEYLAESILICVAAGAIGLTFGFVLYESGIYVASLFIPKLKFAWVLDWTSLLISTVSIIAVGIFSGLFPSMKAQRLQVIEALRNE